MAEKQVTWCFLTHTFNACCEARDAESASNSGDGGRDGVRVSSVQPPCPRQIKGARGQPCAPAVGVPLPVFQQSVNVAGRTTKGLREL